MIFIDPNPVLGFLVLRLALGLVFLPHGFSKIQNSESTAQGLGISPQNVKLLGAAEIAAALLLILNLWTQVGAAIVIVVMLGAIYFKTQKWNKRFTGESGWEFEFILLAAAMAVLLMTSRL